MPELLPMVSDNEGKKGLCIDTQNIDIYVMAKEQACFSVWQAC